MPEERRDVFVSYHTSSAAQTVQKVVPALEAAGVTCWYAPRDCDEQFAGSIVGAIRRCRIFLLLLNEQSNVSAHVLNEINCAFERFKNHEDIALLPFRLDNCALSDDVYYYLGRIHMMDGALPPEELRLRELVDRVTALLGRQPVKMTAVAPSASAGAAVPATDYALTGTLVYPDNHFTGRERELAAIDAGLHGVENVLFLVGMGGIGKSEIAKTYVKRRAQDYDVVLWVNFNDSLEQTVASDAAFPIRGMQRSDFPEDDTRTYFARKLRALKELADRRVLIVIDNFDVEDDPDLNDFCGGAYAVLFTTRCHQLGGNLPEVEVGPMTDPAELMELFRSEYTRMMDEAGRKAAEEIITLLDGHTLTIRLVASAMQSRRIPPEKMLSLLRQGYAGLTRENAKASDLIFGRLQQVFALSTLTEEELFLLKNLSLIPLSGIAVETLFDWCQLDDYDLIDGLIRRSWVVHDPVTDYVHLHPLLCDLMAEELEKDPGCCETMLRSMVRALENTFRHKYAEKQQKLALTTAVCQRLPQNHPLRPLMMLTRADALMGLSMRTASIPLYQELWDGGCKGLEPIVVCGKLAHAQILSGDPESGYRTAMAGWEMTKDIPVSALSPEQGYWRSQVLSRLTESTRDMGDYESSIAYGKLGLEQSRYFYTTTPQEARGWKLWHLAKTLFLMGDLAESERLLLEAKELFTEIQDDWSRSFSLELLGQVMMRKGQFDLALDYSRQSFDLLLPLLGEEHMDVAHNLGWRGEIYTAMGEHAQAAVCYRRAIEIYRKRSCPKRAEEIEKLLMAQES